MKLTDDEHARWSAAKTPAERKVIFRETWRRIRAERSEKPIDDANADAVTDALEHFFDVDLR